jgi:hypothetical protein
MEKKHNFALRAMKFLARAGKIVFIESAEGGCPDVKTICI